MIPKTIPLHNEELFLQAMRHGSVKEGVEENYERLEFYGDSVLDFIITNYLYKKYPHWNQGLLTKARSSIVQEASLMQAALNLNLDKYLEVSEVEEQMDARRRPSILSDLFESVLGAIYIESGMDAARDFVLTNLADILKVIDSGEISPHDYKSKLQEYYQAKKRIAPQYRVVLEEGTIHQKTFWTEVVVDGTVLATGKGRSKKDAEHNAAKLALKKLHTQE